VCQGRQKPLQQPLSCRTAWVSRYQKGKAIQHLNEMMRWQWHQLDHMQIICTSLQTNNHASTSNQFFTGRMLFLMFNQQCQSTEGTKMYDNPFVVWYLQKQSR